MCVNRLSWEASDGKKRARRHSSTPDFEKSEYFLAGREPVLTLTDGQLSVS